MPLFVTLDGERARPFRVILSGAAAQLPLPCHPERSRGLPSRHPERSRGLPSRHPERSEAESKDLYDNNDDILIEIPRKARDDKSKNIFHSP